MSQYGCFAMNPTSLSAPVNFSNITNGLGIISAGQPMVVPADELREFMLGVSTRLNMLVLNPELEKQWDKLRELGDAYRRVEQECMEKAKVWEILSN